MHNVKRKEKNPSFVTIADFHRTVLEYRFNIIILFRVDNVLTKAPI